MKSSLHAGIEAEEEKRQVMPKRKTKQRWFLAVVLTLSSLLLFIPVPCSAGDGNPLYGIWGSSRDNTFVVGNNGTILRYDGNAWTSMTSGTTSRLSGLWGSSPTDVFAAGNDGVIVHFNGRAWNGWSSMASGTTNNLSGVWGSSGKDVFAVGGDGVILHYNGKAWTVMNSGTTNVLTSVWGSSGSDVFAVGIGGTVLHYDGSAWTSMSSGTTNHLYSVWGNSGSDVFAVGIGGTVLHYDGNTWTAMSSGTASHLYGVWGSSSNNVFAVGGDGTVIHFDGSAWTSMSSGTTNHLYGVWGSSGSDVLAAGIGGTIMYYNGSSWAAMIRGETNKTDRRLEQRAASTPANFYIGVGPFIFAEDGADFLLVFRPGQSHWLFGYRFIRWSDRFEDPFTGRELTKETDTKTGPLVGYLFNIEKSGSFYLGVSLLQWSRTLESLVTGESDKASVTALFGGGGYMGRLGPLYYNAGIFLSPGTQLHTEASGNTDDVSGAFDLQFHLGIAF